MVKIQNPITLTDSTLSIYKSKTGYSGIEKEAYYNYIMESIIKLILAKSHDYGEASFRDLLIKYGPVGFLWELDKKTGRARQLLLHGDAKVDESIHDTLDDIIGYCLLMKYELDVLEQAEIEKEINIEIERDMDEIFGGTNNE